MGCEKEKNTGETYDPRYTRSGIYTNQYDLRNGVDVLEIMQDLPSWSEYGPTSTELQGYKVSGWNRATISWSLECEAEGITRQQAFEASTTDIGRYSGLVTLSRCGIVFVVLYAITFCSFCCTLKRNNLDRFAAQRIVADLIFVISAPFIGAALRGEISSNEENVQKLENYEIFVKCGDGYSYMKTDEITAELEVA